jgi:uncharacterized phage infection (PIP) family protein YhgE
MATKKRLADLVREEMNKKSEGGAANPVSTGAKTGPSESAQSSQTKAKNRQPAKAASAQVGGNSALATETSPQPAKSGSSKAEGMANASAGATTNSENEKTQTIATLTAQVQSLTEALATAQTKQAEAETQVKTLENIVAEHLESLKQLRATLKQQETLKDKLEQAKQDALKLAEENQQLQQKLAAMPIPRLGGATVMTPNRAPVKGQLPSTQPAEPLKPPPTDNPSRPYVYRSRKPITRPIVPSRSIPPPSDGFETWCYD